ncbi:MAG: HEAT repeat domain-containing protein [Candidatus Heimdallarchaeota archaeon]|nr:HEAT repeat domain-containing protein [Candidatus Heimdallarchaeota archaeon]MCK4877858.1 HEAT repeat domain-containing protein [Candidatus Heimdallarchaeota archaeon]
MNEEELKRLLLKEEKVEKIRLENIKDYYFLIKFLTDKETLVRVNATKLLFSADYIPTDKIIEEYLKNHDTLIKDVIVNKLQYFIPILHTYLIKNESFDLIFDILSTLQAKKIFSAISKAHIVTPVLATLTEIAIRTCHSSLSNYNDTFINFHFIDEQSKELKKILSYRLKQTNPIFTELTLLTITQFPELAYLFVKQVREIILTSNVEEHIKYGSIILMHLDEPKHADVLVSRLSNFKDAVDTQLAIIEALGNLGSEKAIGILVNQFEKGDPAAYYAARSLALIGNGALPSLITALEKDRNIPYIIESMKRIGESSYDYLMGALQKGKRNVRRNAAQCLTLVMSQKYGYEGAIRLLTTQLAGKNPSILEAVTQALLTLGTPSIKVLIEELIDDDLQLRKNAVEVLQYFGTNNIELALDGFLESDLIQGVKLGIILYLYYPSKELQELGYSFAFHKGKIRSKDDVIFALLTKSLKEIDPEIREKSCDLLSHLGTKSVPILSSILSDPNIRLRRKAVESLRKIKSKRALISLIKAAKDHDDGIAEISTRALGELQDPGVIDVIINNMKRSKALVREASIYAAVKIGSPIVKKLSQQLTSSNHHLVKSTINALSKMESKTLEIILPNLKSAEDKWFNNLRKVVEMMGKSAIGPLRKFYKKERNKKAKERLVLLLAIAQDIEIIQETINQIVEGNARIGVSSLNYLGANSVDSIVKELGKMAANPRKLFIEKSKGLRAELVVGILNKIKNSKKLKSINKLIVKSHTRVIRRYCQDNHIKYSEFTEEMVN